MSFAIAFVAYLGILAAATRISPRFVWTLIVVSITVFLFAPPLLSQDVFSYIAYARLGAAHDLNPYASVPADLIRDPVLPFVGWRESASVYGPLFTLGTYPLGLVAVPVAFWVLKALAALSVLGLSVLVASLAAKRGGSPARAAVFVALNPIVLVHVVGGAHCDGTMLLLIVGGVAVLARRELVSGSALIAAAAIKASAALVFPFAVAGSRSRTSLLTGALVVALLAFPVTFAAFGLKAFRGFALLERNQVLTSKYSVPASIGRLLDINSGSVRVAALAIFAAGVIYLLVRTARTSDWLRASAWAALAVLVTTSWLLPWYVIWVLPFAAMVEDGWLTAATLALCAFQLVNRIPLG